MFYDRKVWEFISKNKPITNQSICLSINVATEILGQNGYQLLDFQTPFYTWLHQHREALIWELTYPNGYQE
jgi:hypothetical protein